HGKSGKPRCRKYYREKVMIRHLNKLIFQLGLRKYSLLGYSMGGRIALAYALAYPGEIDTLILESASYGECGFNNRLKRRRDDWNLAKDIREKGIEWFNRYWSSLSIFDTQRKLPEAVTGEISKRRLANTPHALSNTLLCTGQGIFPCLKNQISRLSLPVLYICGELDEKYRQTGSDFEKLNTGIKRVIITGCGHNTHIEDPYAFRIALEHFLEGAAT
ncbi:MAG: alpha/beta fold hydrolase, partial [Ruminiclostridium sp.]|nr:alpha/beta fold hydrolase [Ruminiclostridium sp.]